MNLFPLKMINCSFKSVIMELSKKETVESNLSELRLTRKYSLNPSALKLSLFKRLLKSKEPGIPPTFPYLLLTPFHFEVVTDNKFPFPPLGILHKEEEISLLGSLKMGKWSVECTAHDFTKLDNGVQFFLISRLYIDNKLTWISKTTAFKMK